MDTASSASNTSWTENVFYGWIDTTWDALLILEAARKGIVPRVTRRFHDIEKRNMIQSGAVIVFTEEESGIKRWTDPYVWSASRMLGNFMIYREREDARDAKIMPATFRSTQQKPKERAERLDHELERAIYGSWRRGKGLKKDGLMKKTFSLVVDGATYHLVGYYNPSDVRSGTLRTPSSMPHIASLPIGPEFTFDKSQFRQPPTDTRIAEELSRSRSESNSSDVSATRSRSTPDSYTLSPVSSFVSSPTLPPAPSHWTPAYVSQGDDSRHAYSSSDGRLHGDSYGHASPYPQYATGIQRYAAVTNGAHTSGHDRYDDYEATPLAWSQRSSYRAAQNSSRPAYEYALDNEDFQS